VLPPTKEQELLEALRCAEESGDGQAIESAVSSLALYHAVVLERFVVAAPFYRRGAELLAKTAPDSLELATYLHNMAFNCLIPAGLLDEARSTLNQIESRWGFRLGKVLEFAGPDAVAKEWSGVRGEVEAWAEGDWRLLNYQVIRLIEGFTEGAKDANRGITGARIGTVKLTIQRIITIFGGIIGLALIAVIGLGWWPFPSAPEFLGAALLPSAGGVRVSNKGGFFGAIGRVITIFGCLIALVIIAVIGLSWWYSPSAQEILGAALPPSARDVRAANKGGFFGGNSYVAASMTRQDFATLAQQLKLQHRGDLLEHWPAALRALDVSWWKVTSTNDSDTLFGEEPSTYLVARYENGRLFFKRHVYWSQAAGQPLSG
jgi:hypothetical protein